MMGPQASYLFLHPAYQMVLTLPFLAPKPAVASHYMHNLLSQIHQDVDVPTCPPLLFSSFHSISAMPTDRLFTTPHTTPYVLLLRLLLMLFTPCRMFSIFRAHFKSIFFLIFLLPPTPPVSGLTKVSPIPKAGSTRGRELLGTTRGHPSPTILISPPHRGTNKLEAAGRSQQGH